MSLGPFTGIRFHAVRKPLQKSEGVLMPNWFRKCGVEKVPPPSSATAAV